MLGDKAPSENSGPDEVPVTPVGSDVRAASYPKRLHTDPGRFFYGFPLLNPHSVEHQVRGIIPSNFNRILALY